MLYFGSRYRITTIFIEITFADAEVVCATDECSVKCAIPDGDVEQVDVFHLTFLERPKQNPTPVVSAFERPVCIGIISRLGLQSSLNDKILNGNVLHIIGSIDHGIAHA